MANSTNFRDRVIVIATELFPDSKFQPAPDELEVLLVGEIRLGLHNIRAKFELANQSEDELRILVDEHFRPMLHKETPSLDDFSLDDLREQIFPQIMPAEYAGVTPIPMVSFPLATGIRIGIVADFPESYLYLRQKDLTRWGISQNEMYRIAIQNLDKSSRGIDIHLNGTDSNTFLAIQGGDGYDAARIMLPELQKFIASRLGETFRFGVPNRDFLICWRIDCAEDFHTKMSDNIVRDNSEQPYPLSSSVFVRNSEGNIHEQTNPKSGLRK